MRWVVAILLGTWWHLIAAFTCSSLVTWDVECLFIGLFAMCIFSLLRCLFRSFASFENNFFLSFFLFLLLSFKSSLHVLDHSPSFRQVFCKGFLPVCACLLILPTVSLNSSEVFDFNEVQLIESFFHGSCLWCSV